MEGTVTAGRSFMFCSGVEPDKAERWPKPRDHLSESFQLRKRVDLTSFVFVQVSGSEVHQCLHVGNSARLFSPLLLLFLLEA